MKKEETDRLNELAAKMAAELTEDEKQELADLKAKKEADDLAKKAVAEFWDEQNKKVWENKPVFKSGADQLDKPEVKMWTIVKALSMRKRGINGWSDLLQKVADPQDEGTSADGGLLVPTITQARILDMMPTFGQARTYFQSMPISGNVQTIPAELTNPTAYWVNEAAAITDSKLTLTSYTLTPKKLAAIVTITNELLKDANVAFAPYILKKIAQAFGTEEDSQFFNGSGSPMTGIFQNTHTFGKEERTPTINLGSLTYQNFLNAMYGVDSNYLVGASWFMHRTVLAVVRGILDGNQRPIFEPAGAGQPATLFGYPVVLVENAPSYSGVDNNDQPYILLGNLENSIIGDTLGMTVKFAEEGTVDTISLLENDLTGIRVIKRTSFTAGMVGKYAVISTAE